MDGHYLDEAVREGNLAEVQRILASCASPSGMKDLPLFLHSRWTPSFLPPPATMSSFFDGIAGLSLIRAGRAGLRKVQPGALQPAHPGRREEPPPGARPARRRRRPQRTQPSAEQLRPLPCAGLWPAERNSID